MEALPKEIDRGVPQVLIDAKIVIMEKKVLEELGLKWGRAAVGEKGGKVASYYDEESEYPIRNLSTYLESFILLLQGCMVAFLALAIFLPMWIVMELAKGGRGEYPGLSCMKKVNEA